MRDLVIQDIKDILVQVFEDELIKHIITSDIYNFAIDISIIYGFTLGVFSTLLLLLLYRISLFIKDYLDSK